MMYYGLIEQHIRCQLGCLICHLPIELEHIVYWAIQKLNFEIKARGEKLKMQLNHQDEFRFEAYTNAKLYK